MSFIWNSLKAQNSAAIQEINTLLYTLDTSKSATIKFLPEGVFSSAYVIALGESSHGTKEFNTVRDYIIRNQILYNEVKIVAMETDFCGLIGLNEYLLNNNKPLDSLSTKFHQSGMYGIYYTKEVLNMLSWIKKYNLSKENDHEKVKLFGLDMQDPYSITNAIMSYFPQLQTYSPEDYTKLLELNRLYTPRREVKMSGKAKDAYKRLADNISSLVRRKASAADTLYLVHYAELLKQTISLREEIIINKITKEYTELRDAYMAANAIWMQDNFKTSNSKMVVWAHNGHIAHAKLNGTHRMGYYLHSYFKEKYYAIEFLFDEGSVRIYDAKEAKKYTPYFFPSSTKIKSVEFVLKSANSPIFFFHVAGATNHAIQSFFKNNKYQRVIGARFQSNSPYQEMPVLECFDGLIFIKKTNSAENIR